MSTKYMFKKRNVLMSYQNIIIIDKIQINGATSIVIKFNKYFVNVF